MASCAFPGGCGNPNCYMCVVMPRKFPQPKTTMQRMAEQEQRKGDTKLTKLQAKKAKGTRKK